MQMKKMYMNIIDKGVFDKKNIDKKLMLAK